MARPLIWEDPEEFDKKVEEYFSDSEKRPTWTGLALFLGFAGRDSLNDYLKKPEFFHSVKKALSRIEEQYENGLFGKNPAGSIFALKNFGWRDKYEFDGKTTVEDNRIDPSKLTDEELRLLTEIQRKSRTSEA